MLIVQDGKTQIPDISLYAVPTLQVEEFCGNLPLRAPPCFLANHIEWKQRGSDRKVRAASLIVSDCLVYFPRPCPPISPVIYARLGQSRSCVAMARDCLHPVMLYSHVGTHSLQRALLFVYHLFRRTPTPSRRCKTGPWLCHRPWLKRSVAACFTPSHLFRCVYYFNSIAVNLQSIKDAIFKIRTDVLGNASEKQGVAPV